MEIVKVLALPILVFGGFAVVLLKSRAPAIDKEGWKLPSLKEAYDEFNSDGAINLAVHMVFWATLLVISIEWYEACDGEFFDPSTHGSQMTGAGLSLAGILFIVSTLALILRSSAELRVPHLIQIGLNFLVWCVVILVCVSDWQGYLFDGVPKLVNSALELYELDK
ncbi:hypothetical protein ACFL2D_01875 [Patescibacteria group bacterium]